MGAAGNGARSGRRPFSSLWWCFLQVALLSAASAFVDRGYWQRSEEVGLMDRIRERAIVAGADVLADPSSGQQVASAGKSSVTSAVPCDLFNRTEWSCWLVRPLNRTQRLVLRLSVADDELDRSRMRVAWRRKHKIRGQNLYAVEEITDGSGWPRGSFELLRDPLSLELNPLADRDRFLNKIQALVYVRRGATGDDPAGLGEVLYGQLTYIIDSEPTVLSPTDGSREVALALEEHVTLPPDGAIIEWKRRLSRVRFSPPPPTVRLLAGGRLVLVNVQDASLSCAVFARDGRFYAMRHFLVTFPVGIQAPSTSGQRLASDLAESTTDGDTVIHLSVKVDSQPLSGVGSGEPADDYTIVQTNVSVVNGQAVRDDRVEASRDVGAVPAGELQNSRENSKPYARPEPQPAVFANNVCFRLIRGPNGAASVVPCDSLSSTTPRPASDTPHRETHSRWRHHRQRGGADVDRSPSVRGRLDHRSRFGSKRRLASTSEEERLRADVDGLQPCRADEECSRHASCVVPLGSSKGRCACDRGYLGNGLFCWEGFYLR